jgi:hypothetical protein
LLIPVMRDGVALESSANLREIQIYTRDQMARLPARFKKVSDPEAYPVSYSPGLERKRWELMAEDWRLTETPRLR